MSQLDLSWDAWKLTKIGKSVDSEAASVQVILFQNWRKRRLAKLKRNKPTRKVGITDHLIIQVAIIPLLSALGWWIWRKSRD